MHPGSGGCALATSVYQLPRHSIFNAAGTLPWSSQEVLRLWTPKRTADSLYFSFHFFVWIYRASFSWPDWRSVRAGVPMVFFYSLPTATEVSMYFLQVRVGSSKKVWGRRTESVSLRDQSETSHDQELSLFCLFMIIIAVGPSSTTGALI